MSSEDPNHSDPLQQANQAKQDHGGQLRKLGLFGVIISELLGFTGIGIGIGYYAWSKWGAPWWVLLLSSLLGLCLAFYRLYLISNKEL